MPISPNLSLAGLTIGISISESEDLEMLGMDKVVLDLAYVEMARHLLAQGARLAYGGDHRERGFTQILFDLVRNYDQPGQDVSDRTVNYLAWPLHLNLSTERRVELLDVARLEELPLPDDVRQGLTVDDGVFLPPTTTEARYVWTRSLTAMRERMNAEIDARVILGGQSGKFLGRYPGIAEEALIALRSGKPIYLLGGFGGCAADLIEALGGGNPRRLTTEYQTEQSPQAESYAALCSYYNRRHPDEPIDYPALCAAFNNAGISGLNNGLDEPANRRLFETDDLDVMVALVLKGLTNLAIGS
jgi:hypothetical protein